MSGSATRWRSAVRTARYGAVSIALLVSSGVTGLATLAATAPPAAAATAPQNLNPDCAVDNLLQDMNDAAAFAVDGPVLAPICGLSVTSFATPIGKTGTHGTPASVKLAWSDGLTPAAELAADQTVSINVDWGDGATSTYNVGGDAAAVANCSSGYMVASTSTPGLWDCNTSNTEGAGPINHNYSGAGNYTISVTVTLFLADNHCSSSLTCPAVGQPPYYITANDGAPITSNVVIGPDMPSINWLQTPVSGGHPLSTWAGMVGETVQLSIETDELDPNSYYHLYVDWGDGSTVAVLKPGGYPGSGLMDFTAVDPDLNHAYAHQGRYTITATVVPCTLVIATTTCNEHTNTTASISQRVLIMPGLVDADVQAVESPGQANPAYTYSVSMPYGGSLPAGVSVTGSVACPWVFDAAGSYYLVSQSLYSGTYYVWGDHCSGLSISDATDYTLGYAGTLIVTAAIAVDVTGSGTFGYLANPETPFSYSFTPQNPPSGVTISGSVTCTKTTTGLPIKTNAPNGPDTIISPPGGSYTIDGSSCSGLVASDPGYTLQYVGGALTLTAGETETDVSVNVQAGGTVVYGQPVTLTATTYPAFPGDGTFGGGSDTSSVLPPPTGSIQFFENGNPVGAAVAVDAANVNSAGYLVTTLTTSHLPPSPRAQITARYSGDSDYASSTSTVYATPDGIEVDAAQTTTSVTASTTSAVYGQPVGLTATVTPVAPSGSGLVPGGQVQFYDNGAALGDPVTLDATGAAALTTTALPISAGDQITADYTGSDLYVGSTTSDSGAATVAVSYAQTATTLTAPPPNSSAFTAPVSLTATVSASAPSQGTPTGSVTFADGSTILGSATLSGGVATLTTADLAVGADSITASYSGDADFYPSTSPALSQTVTPAPTALSVVTSPSPSSVWGQGVTITATVTVPGAGGPGGLATFPTGTVTFSDGPTFLGTGTVSTTDGVTSATFQTASLAVSGHSITASYGGDGDFYPSMSQAVGLSVDQADATVSLGQTSPSVWGQPVTFTATVAAASPGAGTPTGTVTFSDGSTVLGTGTLSTSNSVTSATFTTAGLAVGPHSITATYGGDGNFNQSTSQAVSQTVTQAGTTLSLGSTPTPNPSSVGQTVTFTATVTVKSPGAGTPTGKVTFKDGSSVLGTGTLSTTSGVTSATFTTASLAVGAHSITAVYGGDGNFLTSSTSATQNVDTSLSSYPVLPGGASNLGNVNLSGGYLVYLSLAAASLANSNFTGANFTGANLTNANLSNSNFKKANFTGANLTGANLTKANLLGATGLSTATLTNVHWSSTTCPDGTLSNSDGGTCIGHL